LDIAKEVHVKILLIDDDPKVGKLLSFYLDSTDGLIQVETLAEGQNTLEGESFDLLLLDCVSS
jgi:DNA-binding response OmpR family regulator